MCWGTNVHKIYINYMFVLKFIAIIASLHKDIDECDANGGVGPCNQMCTNIDGSFKCSCLSGFYQIGYNCIGEDCHVIDR